jgi:hypothetical protein
MNVTNDPSEQMPDGPARDLMRLQVDFHARLAEETTRYLRRLQAMLSPAAPGTVVRSDGAECLGAAGRPGDTVTLRVDVENRQASHCMVTPMLSVLADDGGTTWFPDADLVPASALLAPNEKRVLEVHLPLPEDVPPGSFRGVLILLGFRASGIPVLIDVTPDGRKKSRATPADEPQGAPTKASRKDGSGKPDDPA